ncbi:MAG: gamma carbonic anhydrase family protein [Smithellaceae bacterium]|nr:gamma carbonic anhydrase family protein [Smithellaceae bacterium]MDD3258997.1 gamma carbonic anhydrase family protein [Smithellaceae bacterium]MDD3848957.1 gamma carbonic anhydrase family protein [Smithellaceae bacterium]HOG12954.1 gamma carbonic anhydrase family protein [Smithellaceae bacterium]HPL09406.1 gamma carbonic anhydrase family protein [Smithellaceae bacterium]
MALFEFEGKKPQVPSDSFVHPAAVLIGDVRLGHECLIAPGVSIRADFGPVIIGDRSSVQDNSVIHVYPGSESVIGNDVTVAHGAILHDVHIHSRCMIGIGAIILFNAVCEEDVFVSVGSLVPRGMRVPAGKIVAGNPAQIKRDATEKDKAAARDGIEAYRYLCRQYLATMKPVTGPA